MEKYDAETRKFMEYAVEDLQRFMANSGKDLMEKSILAWQAGYIAGIERAVAMQSQAGIDEDL
jgi:hypothetical protein